MKYPGTPLGSSAPSTNNRPVETLWMVASGKGSCDDGMVNGPIGSWVKRLDASLETLLDSTLSRLSLTRRQWQVLSALHVGPLKPVELEDVQRASDVVITMGCCDSCPIYPGKRYEDWELTDPSGQPVAAVWNIRDGTRERVKALTGEHPKPDTGEALDAVGVVIVLGNEAKVQAPEGKRLEVSGTDEPSERGIKGMERMRLVRDDIKARVQTLHAEHTGN